jgi:hypothetical protein
VVATYINLVDISGEKSISLLMTDTGNVSLRKFEKCLQGYVMLKSGLSLLQNTGLL